MKRSAAPHTSRLLSQRMRWLSSVLAGHLLLVSQITFSAGARPIGPINDTHDADACVGIPTGVSWIPNWLYLRTRLAVALWGDVWLTAGEAVSLQELLSSEYKDSCKLGVTCVRLALQLRKLEVANASGLLNVASPAHNTTVLVAAWGRLRAVGFFRVIRSGWPAFEIFRRIHKFLVPPEPPRDGPLHEWDSRCDAQIRPNDWVWLDRFPSDSTLLVHEGIEPLPIYEMNKALKDSQRDRTKICSLAWAVYYSSLAGSLFRKPYLDASFTNDGLDNATLWRNHSFELFLLKSQRYSHDIRLVLSSWWPVLAVLGQISATAVLYAPDRWYVRPFLEGTMVPLDNKDGRIAMVEAGAHDGSDARNYARIFPNLKIWAFEAHPIVYSNLEKGNKECGAPCAMIHATECALGAEDGALVPFFINMKAANEGDQIEWGTDSSSSLYRPSKNASRYSQFQQEPINVRMHRLDVFAKQTDMGAVRFMELDAEGGELSILKGYESQLKDVHLIVVEIRRKISILPDVPLYPEVHDWLIARGFILVIASRGDAMFVRRDLALV